jgi:hypothetical protein
VLAAASARTAGGCFSRSLAGFHASAQSLYRLCGFEPGAGSAAPHLTCSEAAHKRVSPGAQAGIMDVNVDDPVQNHR